MKRAFILVACLGMSLNMIAQHKLMIFFPDKPEGETAALSERALQKRARVGIATDQYDLPVRRTYLEMLEQQGCVVEKTSRWLNAAVVNAPVDVTEMKKRIPQSWQVRKLPVAAAPSASAKFFQNHTTLPAPAGMFKTSSVFNYGFAERQNMLLGIDWLHDQGYTGENVTIAFLDAGFAGFNVNPGTDSTRVANRVLATWDFWNNSPNVFWGDTHGTNVSIKVIGNIPNTFLGMAPHVNVLLGLTDHPVTETHQDEVNYVLGLEWADSLGADMMSISLSYRDFDPGEGDYNNSHMDGNTTIVAKAVKLAARKGMLIVNGAGNDAGIVCTPCDADSILCVGGADTARNYDGISSGAVTADGRIKPDVAALTSPVVTLDSNGMATLYFYGGTSSATPQIAGLAACLKQKYPTATNIQLIQAIKQSGHRASNPDSQVGWGVPNARAADSILGVITTVGPDSRPTASGIEVYPNPATNIINLEAAERIVKVSLYDVSGRLVQQINPSGRQTSIDISVLPTGVYHLRVVGSDGQCYSQKLLKQ